MGYMTICHTFPDNAYAELTGPDIKFWAGQGLPEYEGGLDGFAECYPERFGQLLAKKLVRRIPDDDPAPN